jgi:hypothetical protein
MQFWKKIFFLRFGKKITRVAVVKHRNDIKIQIVHPAINIATVIGDLLPEMIEANFDLNSDPYYFVLLIF